MTMKLQHNKEIQSDREIFYKIFKGLRNSALKSVDMVLPPRCPIGGGVVAAQGELSPESWAQLEFISDPHCKTCGHPFEFQIDLEMDCAGCLKQTPAFTSARSALVYNDGSRAMVLKFKHGDQMHILQSFMPWVMRVGDDVISRCDLVIPVPLHSLRLIKRRYNQAGLMAQYIARKAQKSWSCDVLKRTRRTKPQGFMTQKERIKNVKKAFHVPEEKKAFITGAVIVLVDDVYTTGATVNECAKTLLAAGAAEVHVLTIAKVVKR